MARKQRVSWLTQFLRFPTMILEQRRQAQVVVEIIICVALHNQQFERTMRTNIKVDLYRPLGLYSIFITISFGRIYTLNAHSVAIINDSN